MRLIRSSLIAAAVLLTAGCSSTPAEEDLVASNDDEVVCKTEAQLGSTFKRRTCKTIGEWRAEREAAKELALTRRPEVNTPGSFGGAGRE